MLGTFLYMMAWVFCLGLVAAAPIGPVNTVAIHRGVIGKWSHTLAVGLGSVLVDLFWCAVALMGGSELLAYMERPGTQTWLAAGGAAVLLPMGLIFLWKTARYQHHETLAERRRMQAALPRHLWTDVGTGAVLTIINPLAPLYWAAAATHWMAAARLCMQDLVAWWGLAGAAAGLTAWFCFLAVLVRFTPRRLGPAFFRTVNGLCGVLLLGSAGYCIYLVLTVGHHGH